MLSIYLLDTRNLQVHFGVFFLNIINETLKTFYNWTQNFHFPNGNLLLFNFSNPKSIPLPWYIILNKDLFNYCPCLITFENYIDNSLMSPFETYYLCIHRDIHRYLK